MIPSRLLHRRHAGRLGLGARRHLEIEGVLVGDDLRLVVYSPKRLPRLAGRLEAVILDYATLCSGRIEVTFDAPSDLAGAARFRPAPGSEFEPSAPIDAPAIEGAGGLLAG